ncbi:MAG: hypothetical protein ABI723_04425 [Bacteroidia bacterium]
MKKAILISALIIQNILCSGQVTDSQIAHSLLGHPHYEISHILDSLKVWYHLHIIADENREIRWLSIADGNGVVKVFKIKLDKDDNYKMKEVIINYRHDSREQVENSLQISDATGYHVGYYSTELFFKYKPDKK